MNERIKELESQCWTQRLTEHGPPWFDSEKFAELIVQECVTRLEQHHPFTKDPEAYLYAISLIEEHFEVNQ